MSPAADLARRGFLKTMAIAGGGFAVGLSHAQAEVFSPSTLLELHADGRIVIVSKQPEMGQGVKTSLPMLIAEELDVPWSAITVVQGDFDMRYGWQQSGGSSSTPAHYQDYRLIGASARWQLVQAAAAQWGVAPADCETEDGQVLHRASGHRAAYRTLLGAAAKLPQPERSAVPLKDAKRFRLLGTRIAGVDNPRIVTGQPLFGIDVTQPGLLHACYVKSPAFGGRVASANLDEVKRQPGVRDVFVIEGGTDLEGLQWGVAIVAETTWHAQQARQHLRVAWTGAPHPTESWAVHQARAGEIGRREGAKRLRDDGDVVAAFAAAPRVVEARYDYPFIAHATLEPQNCTAHWRGGKLEIWAPSQLPFLGRERLQKTIGLAEDDITIHLTRCGGGFGRRLMNDFIVEAAAIARRVPAPVKLTYTRADDLQHDFYRPGGFHFLKGALDASGRLLAWQNHLVDFGHTPGQSGHGSGIGIEELPAGLVPHFRQDQTTQLSGVPTGWWRAPAISATGFVVQSFLDELAHAAGQDPLAFKLQLLSREPALLPTAKAPPFSAARLRRVVQAAADRAGWAQPLPRGRGRGIAFNASHGACVAMVAEVTVPPDGRWRVDRVVAVCDVGEQVVNLSGAEAQVHGSVIDALSAAWVQGLDVVDGGIKESGFHDYPLLRMADAPRRIDVHFLPSANPTSGLGEPALPPVAPAVCNAIFAACGKRIRSLPLAKAQL